MTQSGKVKILVQIGSESHPSGSRTGLVSTNGFGKINRRLFQHKRSKKKEAKRNQEECGGGERERWKTAVFIRSETRRRKENGGPINVME